MQSLDEGQANVRRIQRLSVPRPIVSPSHEALLPNVPPASVPAVAEAALEPEAGAAR